MRGRWQWFLGLGSVLLAVAPAGGSLLAPDGFVFEQFLFPPWDTGPIGFTWLPDGRILAIEQNSAKVRIAPVGAATSTVILTIPDVENTGFEQGLLGIACDPGWPGRPYLYFYYNHTSGFCYLTMYTMAGDLSDPTSTTLAGGLPYHILTDVPDAQDLHQAGTVRFGPDGMLYVSQGDDGDPCAAQDASILGGQILRLDVSSMPGAGSGPPPKADITPTGNPLAGPDDNSRLAWAWGLRNPFRFTIDDVTGDLFVGDVGASDWEEVDHVPFASGGGQNFGWPQREGPDPFPCICGTCGQGNTFTEPVFAYPHVLAPASAIGGPLYRSVPDSANSFPSSFDGNLFFAEHYEGIRRLVFDGASWSLAPPLPGQPSATNFAEGLAFFTDLQLGPDGALYMMILAGASRGIYRIRADPALSAPPVDVTTLRLAARPNPIAADGTTISWTGASPGLTRVLILDAAGRRVRHLGSASTNGTGEVQWDGRGEGGAPAPAGVYFYRVTDSGGRERSGKITRAR